MEGFSIAANLAAACMSIGAVAIHASRHDIKKLLRFFTVLSNLFCAAACLTVAGFRLTGSVPQAVLVFKYMGTVTVSVTLLTVLIFLGPTMGYDKMFTGPDLFLHLLAPVTAILSYVLWDRTDMPLSAVLLGALPVLLYGVLYLCKAILPPEEKGWKDFYGFNRGGKWPLIFAVMVAGVFAVCFLLWLI